MTDEEEQEDDDELQLMVNKDIFGKSGYNKRRKMACTWERAL